MMVTKMALNTNAAYIDQLVLISSIALIPAAFTQAFYATIEPR